jgi:hypothetical protein
MSQIKSIIIIFIAISSVYCGESRPSDVNNAASTSSTKAYPHGYPEVKPSSIQHALDILVVACGEKQCAEIKSKSKIDLIKYHHGLGTWIRNNFGLWSGNKPLMAELGGGHPDDMSMVLIEKLWERLNSTEFDKPSNSSATTSNSASSSSLSHIHE